MAYREFFRYALDIGIVNKIGRATHSNYARSNEVFAQQVALGFRVVTSKAGRPNKRINEITVD